MQIQNCLLQHLKLDLWKNMAKSVKNLSKICQKLPKHGLKLQNDNFFSVSYYSGYQKSAFLADQFLAPLLWHFSIKM